MKPSKISKRPIFTKPVLDPFRKSEMDKIKMPGPVPIPMNKIPQYNFKPNLGIYKSK
jgi:hypothetical protein